MKWKESLCAKTANRKVVQSSWPCYQSSTTGDVRRTRFRGDRQAKKRQAKTARGYQKTKTAKKGKKEKNKTLKVVAGASLNFERPLPLEHGSHRLTNL